MKLFILTLLSTGILAATVFHSQQNSLSQQRKELHALRHPTSLSTQLTTSQVNVLSEEAPPTNSQRVKDAEITLRRWISQHKEMKGNEGAVFRSLPEILAQLKELTSADIEQLVESLGFDSPLNSSQGVIQTLLLSLLAENEPLNILKKTDLPASLAKSLKKSAFHTLLQQDLSAAISWLENSEELSPATKNNFRKMAGTQLLLTDPTAALIFLRKHDITFPRDQKLNYILNLLPDEGFPLAQSLSQGPQDDLAKELSFRLLSATAQRMDLKTLKKLTLVLQPNADEKAIGTMILKSSFHHNVADVQQLEKVMTFAREEAPQIEGAVFQGAMNAWAFTDFISAGKFLQSMPASEKRDFGITGYVKGIANLDPESALDWASLISDEQEQSKLTEFVLKRWKKKDATAADAWKRENHKP